MHPPRSVISAQRIEAYRTAAGLGATSELGQNRKYSLRADDVRSTPESGLKSDIRPCPKSATNGLMHCNIQDRYSITSSAVASSEGRIVRPSAFALLRLTISSNLVGCSTGRSPGFAPFLLGRGPLRVNRVGLSMHQRRPVHPGKQTVPESVRTSR